MVKDEVQQDCDGIEELVHDEILVSVVEVIDPANWCREEDGCGDVVTTLSLASVAAS